MVKRVISLTDLFPGADEREWDVALAEAVIAGEATLVKVAVGAVIKTKPIWLNGELWTIQWKSKKQ